MRICYAPVRLSKALFESPAHPAETTVKKIEDTFKDFTNRDDIAIILINQHVANMIRHLIDNYIQARPSQHLLMSLNCCQWLLDLCHAMVDKAQSCFLQITAFACCVQSIPAILEIPSKEHPYDPKKDSILTRVKIMFGGDS